jgi:hypothetical protein
MIINFEFAQFHKTCTESAQNGMEAQKHRSNPIYFLSAILEN